LTNSRILIVGAGSVGQAYGFHLQRAGASVSYFVRERYKAQASSGFAVRCLNGRLKGSHTFVPDGVCTALSGDHDYTQIWLAVSSTALRGDWLKELLDKRGNAVVVMLQPGLNDVALVGQYVPQKALTCGLISLISFHTPLPGEEGPSGMAWMFPPLSPSSFSGPQAQTVVRLLKSGGCAANKVRDISTKSRNGGAVMMPIIGVLSCCHWSFAEISTRTNSRRAVAAVHEALAVVRTGWVSSMLALLVRGWSLRLGLRLAPHFLPFNLERMLQSHFTKVGDQTLAIIGEYVAVADDLGVRVPALQSLHTELDRREIA
jgi:ketopantoate reductase